MTSATGAESGVCPPIAPETTLNIVELPIHGRSAATAALDYEIQYRTIHGYRRAFVHVGKGPAMLLIHGIGDCSDTWRDVIPDLAKNFTILVPVGSPSTGEYSIATVAPGLVRVAAKSALPAFWSNRLPMGSSSPTRKGNIWM